MAATESEHIHHGQAHGEGHGGVSGGHYPGMWVFPDPRQMTRDMAARLSSMPGPMTLGLLLTFGLLVLGVVGFVARAAADGFDDRAPWGYYMATFSLVFMITSGAPVAAVAFRFTKSHWRRPLSRVSELFAVVGIFNIITFIPMMLILPPILNPDPSHGGAHELEIRRTIWFEGPIGAPHAWDLAGIVGLAVTSLFILWLSAVPDMAEARNTAGGFRGWLYRLLAGHWYGTKRQWNAQKAGLALLGAFYFMLLVFVQFIISSDYAQSMIPGYKDAIFPVFYTLTRIPVRPGTVPDHPVRDAALGWLRRVLRQVGILGRQQGAAGLDPCCGPTTCSPSSSRTGTAACLWNRMSSSTLMGGFLWRCVHRQRGTEFCHTVPAAALEPGAAQWPGARPWQVSPRSWAA